MVRKFAAAAALTIVFAACAQVGAPSGGPPDATPPRVTGSSPHDSATSVDRRTEVTVRFSERMNPESVERALFITPYPDPYPDVRWRDGDRGVALVFRRPLDADRTYVITVGTGARDAHGVALAAAHTFAFATGPRLDSGRIEGTVWQDQRGALMPAMGTTVGVYPLDRSPGDPNPAKNYASYETQAGSDGGFSFAYLAPGRYRVIAWADRDGDELLGAGEAIAVPTRDVTLAEGEPAQLPRMRLAASDREPPELVAIRTVDCFHVELRFGEPVATASVQAAVAAPETLAAQVIALPEPSNTVMLRTSEQRSGRSYHLSLRATDPAGNAATWAPDTTLFDAASTPDTSRPRVAATVVAEPIVTARPPSIALWFDDVLGAVPLDSLPVRDDAARVEGRWEQPGPNRLVFTPTGAAPPGRSVWHIPLAAVRDASGNRGRDSVRVTLTRVPPDSLGDLAGTIEDADSAGSGRAIIRAQPLQRGAGETFEAGTSVAAPGRWEITELPAGQYRLFAWRDSDGDAAWSPGRVVPFRPAERWALSDTVTVRPRWTVSGVGLRLE